MTFLILSFIFNLPAKILSFMGEKSDSDFSTKYFILAASN